MIEPPLDAPDEDWLVWADAMQQAGDPRGELIALASHPDQLAKHVTKHADRLLGPTFGRHLRKGAIRVTWRRARLDIVEVRLDEKANGPKLLSELIRSPLAESMRGLAIAAQPPRDRVLDLTQTVQWFREMPIPINWTSLSFIDERAGAADYMITRDVQPHPNLVVFGPLATLWSAVPQLEELRIVVADPGQVQLGVIRLPELRSFALHCLYWPEGLGQLLANAVWPKLSALDLRVVEDFTINDPDDSTAYRGVYTHRGGVDDPWHSTPRDNVDRSDLEQLFAALEALPLERLAITAFNDTNRVLELLEHHALPSLAHLDLSDSALAAGDLERLANNPLLLQLRELVLERIAAPSIKALAGVNVRHSCDPKAPRYRYVVGWE